MKIYISGPITGCPVYYERFAKAASAIRNMGGTPINPAAVNGELPADTTYEQYMDMSMVMLEMADAIYMMPGWQNSKGCNREYGYALARDLLIIKDEETLRMILNGCMEA